MENHLYILLCCLPQVMSVLLLWMHESGLFMGTFLLGPSAVVEFMKGSHVAQVYRQRVKCFLFFRGQLF